MNGILDRVAGSASVSKYNEFRPSNPSEFFALRLAQKLDDGAATRHYAELAESHSQSQLLVAFRRALAAGPMSGAARRFHIELDRLSGRSSNGVPHRRLAAIRIERRSAAVVILSGEHLEYPPLVRQFTSDSDKAL